MRTVAAVLLSGTVVLASSACSSGTGGPPSSTPKRQATTAAASVPQEPSARSSTEALGQDFSSDVYGYTATARDGWILAPATAAWDGADIDHTADYADRFTDANTFIFVVGAPTNQGLVDYVQQHVAWLSENRGCPPPSSETIVDLDGASAERLAIHCPDGVFGATLVSKAIVVDDGRAVILTAFTSDPGTDDDPAFEEFLGSVRWARD